MDGMTDAERLARRLYQVTFPYGRWEDWEDTGANAAMLRAAQALIDSPDWQITWTPPDPAEQIAVAWAATSLGSVTIYAPGFRRLLDDGYIQPGPALEADR